MMPATCARPHGDHRQYTHQEAGYWVDELYDVRMLRGEWWLLSTLVAGTWWTTGRSGVFCGSAGRGQGWGTHRSRPHMQPLNKHWKNELRSLQTQIQSARLYWGVSVASDARW